MTSLIRIYYLLIKEFLAVWKDKRSRLALILPPFLQLFIFAFAATLDVKNVSIGILNKDYGKLSYELIQRFQGSPFFSEVLYLSSVKEIKDVIDNQRVMMVIHIDERFSSDLLSRRSPKLQVILDGRRSNSAQIVQGYALTIVEQYNEDLAKRLHLPVSISGLVERNWFNPNLIYLWFTVPGLVGTLTMFTVLLTTSLSIARERELGTFDQLLVSPLNSIDILIGKSIPGIVIGFLAGSVILTAGVFLFQIPFTGSLLALYFSIFVFVCSIVGVGLFFSSFSRTQQQALMSIFVFISISVILSGFATPIENMPKWLQKLTLINPLRHFLVIIRGSFLKGFSFFTVLRSTYPIAIIALFTLTVAAWFFRRRRE